MKTKAKKKPAKAEKKAVQRVSAKAPRKVAAKASAAPRKSKIGHNSGVNVPLVNIFVEYERLDANIKEMNKAKSDCRARAKEEHGVAKQNFTREIALRKLDESVRVELEQGQKQLQEMLGYQFTLSLLKQEADEEDGEYDEGATARDVEDENQFAAESELH